jgi:hypothetical protein
MVSAIEAAPHQHAASPARLLSCVCMQSEEH